MHEFTRSLRRSVAAAAASLALVLALGVAPASAEPSNKWRIVVDGSTRSGGTVVLRIAPVGGAAQDVTIQVPERTSENQVAKIVTRELKAALGKAIHVERDDFEDVLLKRRGKTPDFEVTLVSSSLTGTSFRFRRE
jgi:hypothetical protein